MQQQRRVVQPPHDQTMIDPLRVVSADAPECDAIEIAAFQRNPGPGNPERIEHQPPQQRVQVFTAQRFEVLARQQIADVGIAPAVTGLVSQSLGIGLLHQE